MTAYRCQVFGDSYAVRADWGNAAAPVERLADGRWESTGERVAYYRHSPTAAMRDEVVTVVRESGDDPDAFADAIDLAVSTMQPF